MESHREGTVLGRFFLPTEAIRSWVQVSDRQSHEDPFYVVFP